MPKKRKKYSQQFCAIPGVSTIKQREIINYVIKSILSAEPKSTILDQIKLVFSIESEKVLETLYKSGHDYYDKRVLGKVERMDVINNHTNLYEEIYKFFNSIDYGQGMNAALLAKEKLLGLHKQENVVELNQRNTVIIEQENIYDLSKLNDIEKKKLNNFFETVKIKEDAKPMLSIESN